MARLLAQYLAVYKNEQFAQTYAKFAKEGLKFCQIKINPQKLPKTCRILPNHVRLPSKRMWFYSFYVKKFENENSNFFQELIGLTQDANWRENNFPETTLPQKLKKIFLSDLVKSKAAGANERWIEHGRIVGSLANLITDPDLFRFLLLLHTTLSPGKGATKNGGKISDQNFEHLHSNYCKLLERRLAATTSQTTASVETTLFGTSKDDTMNCVLESFASVARLVRIHSDILDREFSP